MAVTAIDRLDVGTDDDGSGTIGTDINAAYIALAIYDKVDALIANDIEFGGAITAGGKVKGDYFQGSEQTITSTGTQNDYALTFASRIRVNNATALTLTGIAAPAAGLGFLLRVVGTSTVTFADSAAGSTVGNRFALPNGADLTLQAGGAALVWYDATSTAWRVEVLSRGDEIEATATDTGTQNDYDLSAAQIWRLNNATDLTITGLAAGYDGERKRLISVGAGHVYLKHQDAGSAAGNRLINFATSAATPLAAGVGVADLVYDAAAARWRLASHEQGDWITPAYASGDFTANGSMTWTVSSGNRTCHRYYLRGRELSMLIALENTTVGGTPSSQLKIAVPGGFTLGTTAFNSFPITAFDNSATVATAASAVIGASASTITCFANLSQSGNWSLSTGQTNVYVNGTVSVA